MATETAAALTTQLSRALDFCKTDAAVKETLSGMLACDAGALYSGIMDLLANPESDPRHQRSVLQFLLNHGLILEALTTADDYSLERAVAVVRAAALAHSPLEAEIERSLGKILHSPHSARNTQVVLRAMDIISQVSAVNRLLLLQDELLDFADAAVRSKAALLIGSSTKYATLISRLLRDTDPRVQANAVEALWNFDTPEAKALLLMAAHSKNNRVVGNALVGLYRMGEPSSINQLLALSEHPDPLFRATAVWAMSETGDLRFLPHLIEERDRQNGKERFTILKAVAKLRRREAALRELAPLSIRVHGYQQTEGAKKLTITAHSCPFQSIGTLKPTQIVLWEGSNLVREYTITGPNNPPRLGVDFLLPRFLSQIDPFRRAIIQALNQCMRFLRPDDLWRVDRYFLEEKSLFRVELENTNLPYDDAILEAPVKIQHGFIPPDTDLLARVIENPGPRDRTAQDWLDAIHKAGNAIGKIAGKRCMFLFLPAEIAARDIARIRIAQAAELLAGNRVMLYIFVPANSEDCEPLRQLRAAVPDTKLIVSGIETMSESIENEYTQFLNRFEILYRSCRQAPVCADLKLQMYTENAFGETTIDRAVHSIQIC